VRVVDALWALRSTLSLAAVLGYLGVLGDPWLYLLTVPGAALFPSRRRALVSTFMKVMCHGIFAGFRLGGARVERVGRLPTGEGAILVIGNHQSLLDICSITLLGDPYVPAFVPRALYARNVPLVSRAIHQLECPIVDPKRDPKGAVEAIRRAALSERYGMAIFPEGHRTRDGSIQPFRTAGIQSILEARRMPVYLVVTDGLWKGRRLVDFLVNAHLVRGRVEVLGPFEPPEDPAALPAAIEAWRQAMIDHLARARGAAA
jgi:1-acyl-sn-glycerol-3-phosphate acyltransferase